MPATPDPRDQITGLTSDVDTDDVSKSDHRAYIVDDLHFFSTCNDVRARDLSARSRIMVGTRFFYNDTDDTSEDDLTETTLVIIDGVGTHWLVIEGERYDMPFASTGVLGPGEALPAIVVVTPLTLPADLPGSYAIAANEVATADATITYEKSTDGGVTWADVCSVQILAGERFGTFTLAADANLPAGCLFRPYGPATADATLAGFTTTIAAMR